MLVSYHFAIESVDDRILLPREPIDSAHLLNVCIPLSRVFDDDSEVDVGVFGLDFVSHLLAVSGVNVLRRTSYYVTAHVIIYYLSFIIIKEY